MCPGLGCGPERSYDDRRVEESLAAERAGNDASEPETEECTLSPNTEVANTDLVLLAMALAGAADGFTDVEDIAEQAFHLSPQRFGWRTRSYPSDKTVVQAIADLEAKHAKNVLTRRGVKDQADKVATRRLTVEGREAARRVAERVAGKTFDDLATALAHFREPGSGAPEPTPAERRRAQAELVELRRQRAFQFWADGEDLIHVERWQLLDALSCLPDAPPETVGGQTEKLAALAERWNDQEVLSFLRALTAVLGTERAHN